MNSFVELKNWLAVHDLEIREFDSPTPDVASAALAVGCSEAEIIKTVVFMAAEKPVAVATCGDMKVSSGKLKKALGVSGKVMMPNGEQVLASTGYPPGAVSPFLLPEALPLLIDSSVRRFCLVWPAGGNDRSAVAVAVDRLFVLTGGREAEVCVPLA